jgi:hypothetical protein
VSLQDKCMVCSKRTRGLEIVLVHPMVILGDKAQVQARFDLFGDSANLDARQVHSCVEHIIGYKIVLNAPDGTPR